MNAKPAIEPTKDLAWAEEASGLSEFQLVKLARSGLIPGSFNLTRSRKRWRFKEAQFRAWLDEVSERGLGAFEVAP